MSVSGQDILFLQNKVAYTRDEQAYKKLFIHFHAPLFRFAFHLLKDTDLAGDAVSDVMMRIWDMGSRLAQVEQLRVYLFTAVKNTALNQLAKKRHDEALDDRVEHIAEGDDPEHHLMFTETQKTIEKAILSLPSKCQLVYRLIREEGFSYKEVAQIAGISQNTIETHMRLALQKIRLALHNYLQGK